MTRTIIRTLGKLAIVAAVIPVSAMAAETQDDQFKNIDAMLGKLQQPATKNNKTMPTQENSSLLSKKIKEGLNPPREAKTPIVMINQATKESKITESKPPKQKPILTYTPIEKKSVEPSVVNPVQEVETTEGDTRLSELPPSSRFYFESDLFVPAHKKGVLFVNGKNAFSLESTANHLDVLGQRPSTESACAITSNKSYMMMRGGSSFLDANKVEFLESTSPDGQVVLYAQVSFESKPIKNKEDGTVDIKVSCRVPVQFHDNLKAYTLGEINKGLGGLFTFELPQFIEI